MRKITHIVVHCTAGNQDNTASQVKDYHLRPKSKGGKGWRVPGYHYIIEKDGTTVNTYSIAKPSNGVKGYNATIINVCWVGGVDTSKKGLPTIDNRTPEQKTALRSLLAQLKSQFPDAIIVGHRDFSPDSNGNGIIDPWEMIKACPCFDAKEEYKDLS